MKSEEKKMVDIKGLDKARVLKALYEHSHVQGERILAGRSRWGCHGGTL